MQGWRLEGKTALITGASRGIGRALSFAFAERGADLALVARDEDQLDLLAEELSERFAQLGLTQPRLTLISADVSDGEGRVSVFEDLREARIEPHILINNVGNNVVRNALEYSDADLSFILQTNVASAFEMSRLCFPLLKTHGSASIVNVASVSGLAHVRTGVAYGMSKAALVQMTRNLACEWAKEGVRVNAIAPWYIRTQRSEVALADPDYLEEVLSRTPMGRIGEAEEVAAAAVFLSLPCASYITGQCLAIDGGFSVFGF
jgi:tropinone reductase I